MSPLVSTANRNTDRHSTGWCLPAEAPDRLENLTLEKLHSIVQEQGIQSVYRPFLWLNQYHLQPLGFGRSKTTIAI